MDGDQRFYGKTLGSGSVGKGRIGKGTTSVVPIKRWHETGFSR
jgi:hypothetical protein